MKRFARFFLQQSKELYDTDIKSVLRFVHSIFEKVGDDKRPRDLRPILNAHPGMTVGYTWEPIQFALLSKDREIITSPTHCRDYFNEAIRFHIHGNHSAHCNEGWPGEFDMRKFRAVMFLDTPRNGIAPYDGIKNGVRVANMYGRVAGWSPIRLVRAKIPYKISKREKAEKECYVLIGDRNWQRTPQYISMLLLLIRVCLVYRVPEWITDAYALTGWWYEFLYETMDRPGNSDIVTFLSNSYDHMLLMMAHEREIFPSSMITSFGNVDGSFHSRCGLNSLIDDNSTHPESAKRLQLYYATEVLECLKT